MGRLVDADKFCDFVKENCKDNLADLWCELIRRQPTVFDVDKVIEELNGLQIYYDNDYLSNIKDMKLVSYDEVMEIVKRGGVNECM